MNTSYFIYKHCNYNFPLKGTYIVDNFDKEIIVIHNTLPYILSILLFMYIIYPNILFISGYISVFLNISFFIKNKLFN